MPVFADDDRFENLNRKIFTVNDRLDRYRPAPGCSGLQNM